MTVEVGELRSKLTLDNNGWKATIVESGRMLKDLAGTFDKTGQSVDKLEAHFDSLGTKFRHLVQFAGAARFAVMDLYDVFLRLPQKILESTGEVERMTKVMEGLSKQSGDAAKQLEALNGRNFIFSMALTSPFDVKSLQDAFVKLKAGGVDPMNGSMKALVDSVAKFGGTSQTLDRASVAIQQMSGKGVISMEELRQQLGEAIPEAMRYMAEGAGMAMKDFVAHVSKGEIGAREALRRMFFIMDFENRGAALKMMDTFVGMTAQLKTQMTLAFNDIGEAGFMSAIKDQMKDLIEMLRTPAFKEFTQDLGRGLGEAVKVLADLVKNAAQYWDYIKAAGTAFLYYFGGTTALSIIARMSSAIRSTGLSAANAAADYRTFSAARMEAEAQNAAFDAQQIQKEVQKNNTILVEKQQHLLRMQRQYQIYLAEIDALEAARAAKVNQLGLYGAKNILPDMTRQINNANIVAQAQKDMIASEAAAAVAIQQNIAASRMAALEKEKLAGAIGKVSAASAFMAGTMRAGQVVLTALGGWFGVLTAAITLGIFAWEKWGNTAEKALKQARDAVNKGFAKKEDVDAFDKQLAAKRAELASIDKEIEREQAKPGKDSGAVLAALQGERAQVLADLNETQRQLTTARTQFQNTQVEEEVAKFKTAAAAKSANELDESRNRIAEWRSELEKKKTALGENYDAIKKLEDDFNKRASAERTKVAKEQLASLIKQRADFIKSMEAEKAVGPVDPVKTKVANRELNELNAAIADATKFQNEALNAATKMPLGPKKEGPMDPLLKAIEQAKGQLEAAKIKLDDLKDGALSIDRVRASVEATLMGKAKAGEFDKVDPNDPKKRDHLIGKNGQVVSSRKADFDKLVDLDTQIVANKAAIDAVSEANNVLTRSKADAETASKRLTDNLEKEDSGYRKVERSLATLGARIIDQQHLSEFNPIAAAAKKAEASANLDNFLAESILSEKKLRVQMQEGTRAQREQQYQEEKAHYQRLFDLNLQHYTETNAEDEKSLAHIKLAHELFNKDMEQRELAHTKAMRTPVESLAAAWLDTETQIGNATARWAQSTVDAMVEAIKTGSFDIKTLLTNILSDIAKMQIQQQIAKPMMEGMNALGEWMQTTLFGGTLLKNKTSNTDSIDAASKVTATSLVSVSEQATASATAMVAMDESLTTTTTASQVVTSAFTEVTAAATAAAAALHTMSGGVGGGGGAGGGFAGMFGKDSAQASPFEPDALPVGEELGFAKGGIMSEFGRMPLHRYARGGIAKVPQMAMFGEGSLPEAYVPLPDGKSIPVTVNGQGGSGGAMPNVVVNVINQSGQQVQATQQGTPRMDAGQMVLDVVLSAATRPGPFRDNLRSAVR